MFNEKKEGGMKQENQKEEQKKLFSDAKSEKVEKVEKVKETSEPEEEKITVFKTDTSQQEEAEKTTSDSFFEEESGTIDEIDERKNLKNKIKNLTSLMIILIGLLLGSLFVDFAQFISGKGYSPKALENSEIFVAGDKTWVAFGDPMMEVKILTVDQDEYKDCPNCDPTEVLRWLKRFIPTMVPKKILVDSPEGKEMIKKIGIKTIPAFVFSKEIAKTKFYQEEAQPFFQEKDGQFVLRSVELGIPLGKYLEVPQISEEDFVKGSKDAKVKIIVFSDFQCPYCKSFFSTITKLADEYKDKLALVYKDLPLDFHPQANNAALAANCAGEQGKFWEMAKLLYDNQDKWGQTEGTASFEEYAINLGINKQNFKQCLEEKKFASKISQDSQLAQNFGISGTPAVFVNDQFFNGAVSEEKLKSVIEKELQETN